MKFPDDFFVHLAEHTLTGIKGGVDHHTFLEIWMVTVDNRVFARSWNKSARSWFTAFQQFGVGELKYGDKILRVEGRKLEATSDLNTQIDEAYLKRYNQPENIFYAQGISQPEYADYTMEFFPTASGS